MIGMRFDWARLCKTYPIPLVGLCLPSRLIKCLDKYKLYLYQLTGIDIAYIRIVDDHASSTWPCQLSNFPSSPFSTRPFKS